MKKTIYFVIFLLVILPCGIAYPQTPSAHQWGVFTDSTHAKGVTVPAQSPVCTDSNGEPTKCLGTEGVWAPYYSNYVRGSGTQYYLAYWSSAGTLGPLGGLGTAGQVLTSNGAGALPTFQTQSGTGTLSASGTPTNHQWSGWTNSTTLKGFTVTASKPVCTDSSGDPAVCAGTEGVWQAALTNPVTGTGTQYYLTAWGASGVTALASLGASGNPLISNGAGALPSFLSVVLAGGTNTFSVTNGTASLSVAAGSSLAVAAGKAINFSGTFTDSKICTWATGGAISCNTDLTGFSGGTLTTFLKLKVGSAGANGAPLYFQSGTNLGTPAVGAMEYDGTYLYFTPTSAREKVWTDSLMATIYGITDGTYGMVFSQNTSAIADPASGKMELGFIGTDLYTKAPGVAAGKIPKTAADVVAKFNSGTCSGYLKSDGSCSTPTATIEGSLGATANVVPKSSGVGGVTLQASGISIDSSNNVSGAASYVTTKSTSQDSILLRGGTTGSETKGVQQLGPVTEPTDTTTIQWPAETSFATGIMYWTLSGHTITPSTLVPGTGVVSALGNNTNSSGGLTTYGTDVPLVANVKTYMGADVQSISETSEAATCNWANGSTCVIAGEANTTAWTLTMSNPVSGQVYRIYVTQQTGGPVPLPTFSPTVTWVNGAPTFSGTNTKHDAITCQYVVSTYFCGLIGNNF